MKSYYRHILTAAAALLAVIGCTKTHEMPQNPEVSPICLSATEAGRTKALLDADKFQNENNWIRVYDILTDQTVHINDRISQSVTGTPLAEATAGVWPFEHGPYQWTADTHKFFGWLDVDANSGITANSFFNRELILSQTENKLNSYVLEIPQVAFTKDTPQFDFMYSNIYITEPINTPVPLEFSHLFSAFYITGLNRDSENTVKVKEITLSGLNGTKSAQIDFGGETTAVTYTDGKGNATFSFTYAGELLSTTAKALSEKYMIWPQTTEDFADATLYIKYDYTSDGQTKEQERTIPLSSIGEWNAGVVNSINIAIDVDQITFYINSLEDWNTEEKDIIVEM